MTEMLSNPFWCTLLIAAGWILIFLEIFIPSLGVLAFSALACVGLGVYGFFFQGHYVLGWGAILVTIGASFSFVRFALGRLSLGNSLPPEVSTSADESLPLLVGKHGVAITALRPAGLALIEGQKIDVVAASGFIEKSRHVEVSETSGNRVVVRERPSS